MKKKLLAALLALGVTAARAQDTTLTQLIADTLPPPAAALPDTALRIVNINPFFTLHVDSSLQYQLQVNKDSGQYFWYLKNSPVGLRINKDNGTLSFRADKSLFLSGRLKYDVNYKVLLGVQNLKKPEERIDTSFTLVFYSTEIIPSRVKPTVSSTITLNEGEPILFSLLCETGSFPVESILTLTSIPISGYQPVRACGESFSWTPPFDHVREGDSGRVRPVTVQFIGTTRFGVRDTATVRLIIRDALNYPLAQQEHNAAVRNVERYVLQLKYTFLLLDKRLKKTKTARTTFDLTSASTSLTGTVMSTSGDDKWGKILPSVGLALVPIKEASSPNRIVDQNQAALIRTSIKRLEYMVQDNALVGERDADISRKTAKLREELKQIQVQLIEVPMEFTNELTEAQLNRYFNSPKVNKKYRLKS